MAFLPVFEHHQAVNSAFFVLTVREAFLLSNRNVVGRRCLVKPSTKKEAVFLEKVLEYSFL